MSNNNQNSGNSVTISKTDSNGKVTTQTKSGENAKAKEFNSALLSVAVLESLNKIPEKSISANKLTGRDKIYFYPEDCVSLKDQRKFRNGMRKKADGYLMNILHVCKNQNVSKEERNSAFQTFIAFYKGSKEKGGYNLQNFEISSLSNSQNETQLNYYRTALQIVKSYVAQTTED